MKFQHASRSDIGRKRQQNQDSCSTHPDLGLFVVADGMGGHLGGETASSMVTGIVPEFIQKEQAQNSWDPKTILSDAIREANFGIFDRAAKDPALQGMGTTTTALLFTEGALTIGHVGDSRCYYFRPDECWQLTRDHSLVQEKLRAGLITREQLKTDTMKNIITRSVGFEPNVEIDIYEMEIQAGDLFMVCSDGLSGMIEDPKITQLIKTGIFEEGDLEKTSDTLIHTANDQGGEDNITVVLVQVLAP